MGFRAGRTLAPGTGRANPAGRVRRGRCVSHGVACAVPDEHGTEGGGCKAVLSENRSKAHHPSPSSRPKHSGNPHRGQERRVRWFQSRAGLLSGYSQTGLLEGRAMHGLQRIKALNSSRNLPTRRCASPPLRRLQASPGGCLGSRKCDS